MRIAQCAVRLACFTALIVAAIALPASLPEAYTTRYQHSSLVLLPSVVWG
jgi:hypothetical protein